MYVWVALLVCIGVLAYIFRGLKHPQKMQYPPMNEQNMPEGGDSLSYNSFNLQEFNPFHTSHKASHLHHLHSIKSKEHIMANFFPNEKVQKSTTPNTQHLQKLVDKHQRQTNPKKRKLKSVNITHLFKKKIKPKPLHAIEKIALVEELRQMIKK